MTILIDIKRQLGIDEADNSFDSDILFNINSAFTTLSQVADLKYILIKESTNWSEILDDSLINIVKMYLFLKTRIIFDPPNNSTVLDSINKQISELEWRINTWKGD